jgi:hypothetical protein
MPKDNPEAYRKIDEFFAGLSQEELKYAYGAIEAMMDDESEMQDSAEESMPEADTEMAADGAGESADAMYDFEDISK